MNDTDTLCPITGSYHKYFMFSTKSEFEPVIDSDELLKPDQQLYRRVEYAILNCNCTSVIKKRIIQKWS